MKCLTLFLLIIFCIDLISSTPFTEKDYDETLKDIRYLFEEGKEDAKFVSSTTNEELTSSVAAIETEENPTISSSTTNKELTSSVATENEERSNDDVIPTTTSAPEDSLITKISTDVPSITSTPEESETSTTTIDIPSTTTTAPEDLSIYTKENLLKRTQSRFNDFRKEFLADHKEISEKFKSDQREQETSSSMFVNFFQNKYDKEVNEINENIKNLESKRLKIESSIQKSLINDAETLKELKEQQKLFKTFKNSDCKDCHGFLDINDVNTELESIDKKISELENKEDANKSEKEALDTNQLEELNTKYMELIQIYQYEAREWEKKESFGFINKIILEKHINDSESLERNIKEELNHRTDLAERLLNIDKIQSSKSSDKSVDKYFEKCSTESFEWVDFVNKSHTEKHGVQAGVDGDSSKVFVIRETSDFPPLYGKIALRLNSNDAYVTDRTSEFSVKDNIQILTANSYSWVSSETHKHAEGSPPICRAKKSGVMVPGTLLKTRCRIGFGFGVSFYDEDYEILTFNICKKTNLKDIKKWYK